MKNYKDVLTNICGLLIAVFGALIGVATQVSLPTWLVSTSAIVVALSTAILGWASGKKADLTKKK